MDCWTWRFARSLAQKADGVFGGGLAAQPHLVYSCLAIGPAPESGRKNLNVFRHRVMLSIARPKRAAVGFRGGGQQVVFQ